MKYSITIYLESKEDVIRKIDIDSKVSLLELHKFIKKSFNIQKDELASFYTTNNELELLEEIPLFTFEDNINNLDMENGFASHTQKQAKQTGGKGEEECG